MVRIGEELVAPDGEVARPAPQVMALAGEGATQSASAGRNTSEDGTFTAQGAREGVAAAGALMQAVNFPEFCAGLINGVFHSIVQSSIEQMEAYAKLVADVSKSLSDFRDENTTQNQGRDHLVQNFPDLFQLQMGGDDPFAGFGGMRRAGSYPTLASASDSTGMRRTPRTYSNAPIESCERLSKRVYSPKNFSFTEPVGPLRCLPMMTSARPLSGEFSLL